MNLKELTWENHKSAERKDFAKVLMSGSIDCYLYYKYLYNQYYCYLALESKLPLDELGISEIARADKIREDITELEQVEWDCGYCDLVITNTTVEYVEYCQENYDKLLPHMYVRHFGDMYGGAMIAKKIPGQGQMYKFNDKEALKTKVRAMLDDSMADEANRCFEFAIKLFGELSNERF